MTAFRTGIELPADVIGLGKFSWHKTFEQNSTLRSQLLGILVRCLPFQGVDDAAWCCAIRLGHTLDELTELLCKWRAILELVDHLIHDVGSVK